MKFKVKTIPHKSQRYKTVGNYGDDWFEISETGNEDYNFLILLHEILEWKLTRKRGIMLKDIDAWDLAHLESDDPGRLKGCPYRKEHIFAEKLEKLMAKKLKVNWKKYDRTLKELE